MIKNFKCLKMNVFKNASQEGGAMKEAIKHKQPNDIIIRSQTKKNGQWWASTTPEHFLKQLSKNNGLYEVIIQYPHKMYFDIDHHGKPEENLYNIVVDKINEI